MVTSSLGIDLDDPSSGREASAMTGAAMRSSAAARPPVPRARLAHCFAGHASIAAQYGPSYGLGDDPLSSSHPVTQGFRMSFDSEDGSAAIFIVQCDKV
jgi:hypothetical protein